MRLGLSCPHWGSRPVEVARKVWFLHGFVLFARHGSRTFVGCRRCVRRQVWTNLLICALGGWWCVPWGLGVPVVVLQNLLTALWPVGEAAERLRLGALLADVGVELADVELDADGFTREQREAIGRMCAVLYDAVRADGSAHASELDLAARILVAVSGGALARERAERMLAQAPPAGLRLDADPYEQRVALLEAALSIIGSDGTLAPAELRFVHDIGRRLALPPPIVERVMQRVLFGREDFGDDAGDDECAAACATLGLSPGATMAEIRRRYRELVMRNHPDVAHRHDYSSEQATEITQRLNWAYDVLRRRQAAAA